MGIDLTQEVGRMAEFAETNGSESAKERIKKRLSQDRKPSTAASTETWVNWGAVSDLLGQPFDVSRIPISKLEAMQRDPMLNFGLMFVKVPLIRAPWYIKSSDPQRAAFIDNALRRIYGRLILAYSNSFAYGFSAIVKRFEYDKPDWTYIDSNDLNSKEAKVWDDDTVQALVWKPFLPLNPRHVEPHWNKKGEFTGIDLATYSNYGSMTKAIFQTSTEGKVADIPLDWALWATNEKDSVFGSLWGYPRLGYAYRYWWSYWYLFNLADRAYERWADPPVVVYHPTEDASLEGELVDFAQEGLNVAEKARSGANISLPSDAVTSGIDEKAINMRHWQIEQLKAEINFSALDSIFKYLDVQKLRSMLVPEQSLMEGQGGSSSRNVAEQFGDIFQESQAVVMQEIDDMINRYMIPQLLEANFGPGGPTCTKITTGFDPQDIETMRSIISSFANKDVTMPVDIRETLERMGVPTLSRAAFKQELENKVEEAKKLQPPVVKPTGGAVKMAGVNEDGLYFKDRDQIILVDDHTGVFKKAFDKLLRKDKEGE